MAKSQWPSLTTRSCGQKNSKGKPSMKFGAVIACCGAFQVILVSTQLVHAQSAPVPNIGDAVRQADETRKGAPLPRTGAEPVLPRLLDPPFTLKGNTRLLVRS